MQTKIVNEHNLKDEEMDVIETRVKAFIINDENKILLATADGSFQLPGGHRENDEDYKDTLIREIQEEAGMDISHEEITPFFEYRNYMKNYHDTGENRLSQIIYFYLKTNNNPDPSQRHLTEFEALYNFQVSRVTTTELEEKLNNLIVTSENSRHIAIAKETLYAFSILKDILKI